MVNFWDWFEYLDVLDIDIQDGEPRLKLGRLAQEVGLHAAAVPWGQTGVVALPDPPDDAGACIALSVVDGRSAHVWHTYDARYASKIGQLPAGSRGFITRGEARFLLNPERDQISAYTLTSDGKVMMSDLDGAGGVITIMVDDLIVSIDKNTSSIKLTAGSNFIELSKSGLNISAAASNLLGACDIGGDGSVAGDKVMLSTALLAWVAEVNAALTTLATHTHTHGAGAGTTAPPAGVTAPTTAPLPSSTVTAAL